MKKITPAEEIAVFMSRLYDNSMTTTSGGNLSIMDEDGTLWISPSGVDKAHLTADDIIAVDKDANIKGKHKPSTEYPFHLAIYKARPDIRAVLHAHPSALVAFSLARVIPNTAIMPNVAKRCGKVMVAKYAIPGSKLLGSYIAQKFTDGADTVILENHGVVLGSHNMQDAYEMFETLDFCARTEINAKTMSANIKTLSDEELDLRCPSFPDSLPQDNSDAQIRNELCSLSARCYNHRLFTSTQGAFICRAGDTTLATPENKDRAKLEECDIVRVSQGCCESGKTPSTYTDIANKIFAGHSDIKCIVVARSPQAMAFVVSDAVFDSHLIPEGYICLKNVVRHPFGTIEQNPSKIVESISMKAPIAIIENDCVLIAGTSPLNAYDRLEVMEFGAMSIKYTVAMKTPIIKISDEDIKDIEVTFGL